MESFLSRSASDSGFQGEDDEVTWESSAGEAALDNSLSSFRRETVNEAKKRARKEALAKELDDESDIDLTDEEVSKAKDPNPRKISLSPTQFLQSRATRPLNKSATKQSEAIGNSLVSSSSVQVLEAKGKGASSDVPIEEVASTVASGAISIQRDNQGSSSFSSPSLSFNLPPAERAQVLHRSLAAELILAGTGTSPLIPPARHSQEPGTAISMIAHNAARRNNPNPSAQVSEAGAARGEAQAQQAAQPRIELARGQSGVANVRRGLAVTPFRTAFTQEAMEGQDRINAHELQRMEADRVMRRGRREAATPLQVEPEAATDAARTASTASDTTVESTPVMDMRFCIEHLDVIRNEAGDSPLSDFSDYWASDHSKTTPNLCENSNLLVLVHGLV